MKRSSSSLLGTVRNLDRRTESLSLGPVHLSTNIWNFVLEQMDTSGNVSAKLPVELRALTISGVLNNGDEVQLGAIRRATLPLRPATITNLTNGSPITTSFGTGWTTPLFKLAIVVGLIALALFGYVWSQNLRNACQFFYRHGFESMMNVPAECNLLGVHADSSQPERPINAYPTKSDAPDQFATPIPSIESNPQLLADQAKATQEAVSATADAEFESSKATAEAEQASFGATSEAQYQASVATAEARQAKQIQAAMECMKLNTELADKNVEFAERQAQLLECAAKVQAVK